MTPAAYRSNQIVFTNKAKCLDCNRCVRVCPVKAIKMKDGQAQVDPDRCVVCGTCIRECPQKAKTYRNDLESVKELIASGKRVAVAIAPSFAVVFDGWRAKKIPSVLRSLGFAYVAETAFTAAQVSVATKEFAEGNSGMAVLGSSCPAFVNLIEKYHPSFVKNLAPVCSPMIATAKTIRRKFAQDAEVVFIGPCTAKKYEAERKANKQFIAAALTFEELTEWISESKIDIAKCEDSDFDLAPSADEKLFALSGGMYKAGNMEYGSFTQSHVAVTGYDEIIEVIDDLCATRHKLLAEPLFCKFGCINGPAVCSTDPVFARKRNLIDYAENSPKEQSHEREEIDLKTRFTQDNAIIIPKFSEDEILQALEKIGKSNPEDQLDCTSCGYPSCKDKAIAVLCGMAEEEMCVPLIRKRSQQKADKIIASSPNGIVMVNDKYEIADMNEAFKRMFMCSNSMVGKPISTLMDPEPFVKVATTDTDQIESITKHESYNLVCQQIVYPLKSEKRIVGVFVNLTNTMLNKTKLDDMKRQTVMKATELLEHQIDMAQKIAKLLGESTAQGEELVSSLVKLTEDDQKDSAKSRKKPWDTYTSR